MLEGAAEDGRALLRLLIVERLTMTPTKTGYSFAGVGTAQPVLEGEVEGTYT
jgi:hypothetical protein